MIAVLMMTSPLKTRKVDRDIRESIHSDRLDVIVEIKLYQMHAAMKRVLANHSDISAQFELIKRNEVVECVY
jgi:hypothetical protein